MRKRHLVLVKWDDISSDNTWHNEDGIEDCRPLMCLTVGWRMSSAKGMLRISSTRSEHGKCVDVTAIPKGCIRNIRRLE